jgi:hypothetical protein
VAAQTFVECFGNLADGCLGARGINRSASRLPSVSGRCFGQHVELFINLCFARVLRAGGRACRVAGCARTCIVDLQHVDLRLRHSRNLLTPTTVCSPLSMRACVRAAASSMRSFRQAFLDGLGHAAHLLDFLICAPARLAARSCVRRST